ncbi:MAG: hypothetical protein JO283_16215 [Bradyrhizobium sp.]|nr:hypothetical protein [Bradyrhizobium sp.]
MRSSRIRIRLEAWAGLWFAGLTWATNMFAGQILPVTDCDRSVFLSACLSLVFTVLALTAGLVSWRAASKEALGFASPDTLRFDAMLSALSALVFSFALFLQTIASLVLTGCER